METSGSRSQAPNPGPTDNPSEGSNGSRTGSIVVVGGGFGGLYTAQALSRERRHPPLLLVEPREQFVFLPLLYELLSGELRSWEIAPRYDTLLANLGVGWLQDRVDRIDLERRTLQTAAGRSIPWRTLVLASGASVDTFGVPGAERHCLGFRSLADVQRLQEQLELLRRSGRPLQRLAVVGGGPTGVELACKLADLAGSSTVVELIEQGETLLPQSRAFNREQALLSLQRRDVRVRTRTRVVEVAADRLQLRLLPSGEEQSLAVQGVIWTAGQRCRPPLISPTPQSDGCGRLLCDQQLRLLGRNDVFVVGDLAAVPQTPQGQGLSLPTSAQVAFQQAPVVAANLLAHLEGREPQPFRWTDLGEMLSLGRGEAALTSSGITLAGPAAFQLRRLAYLTRLPGLRQQLRVAAGWLTDWAA
jgi:NADH dehydrogenase